MEREASLYPVEGSSPQKLRFLARFAALAPSIHNSQPWRLRSHDDVLDLEADRTRSLPVNDPQDRELVMSCGAALYNLRIAFERFGAIPRVETFPEGTDSDVLARLRLGERATRTEQLRRLYEAMLARHTYRRAFEPRPVDPEVTGRLIATARAEGAWLAEVPARNRHAMGALIAEADRAQWSDPRWRHELALWLHPKRSGDGVHVAGVVTPLAQAVVRTFDLGNGRALRDEEIADGSPLLVVLGTVRDDPSSWLAAGQALEAALLEAAAAGVQASFLNQPIEVPVYRGRVKELLDGARGHPQLILRFGYPAGEATHTPRRPLSELLDG